MKDGENMDMGTAIGAEFDAAARPRLTIDVERYQHYLDDSGMSEAEKRAFLEALWSIITAFIDLGFGVHPLQEVCGQNPQESDQRAAQGDDSVEYGQTRLSRTFNDAPETE